MEVSVVFSVVLEIWEVLVALEGKRHSSTSLELSYQWRREGECRRLHSQGDGAVHLGTNYAYLASVSLRLLCAMLASKQCGADRSLDYSKNRKNTL